MSAKNTLSDHIGKDRIKEFLQGIATSALEAEKQIERNDYSDAMDWIGAIHSDLETVERWIVDRMPD
jgi:hypothetical protein